MVSDGRAGLPLQSLKRRLLAKKRPPIEDKMNQMNDVPRRSREVKNSDYKTPRSSSMGPVARVAAPESVDHTPSLPPLPPLSRASHLPGHVTDRIYGSSSPGTQPEDTNLGQSISCPDLIDEIRVRYSTKGRSKGSPASMSSAPNHMSSASQQSPATARLVKNTNISVSSSPIGSPLTRKKQGIVSPRKNSHPLIHRQSTNTMLSRKSSLITDGSLPSSNKTPPTGKTGLLTNRSGNQIPLTSRSINTVTGDQPTSGRNSQQTLHNHTTIHIKVDNDNVAHVVDVKEGYVETISEEEQEVELPSGMSQETFDRCCRWVEQVNMACKDNRSVDDCAMAPVRWSDDRDGTNRT